MDAAAEQPLDPDQKLTPPRDGRLRTSFKWLNFTQFFGALNDNFFQGLLIFALIRFQQDTGEVNRQAVMSQAGTWFALPFLMFMAAAGILADRHRKSNMIRSVKIAELGIMLFGVLMFYLESSLGLLVVLFCMGTQSAFFGPSKYGSIRELVGRSGLSRANGYLQAATYLAIILGVVAASFLSEVTQRDFVFCGLIAVGISVLGLVCALQIAPTPVAGTDEKISPLFFLDIWDTLKSVRHDRYLIGAVFSLAYFLLVAAFLKLYIIPYGAEVLGLTDEQSGYLFLFAAVGVGLGALLAGRLSKRNIEFGVIPIGALLLTLGTLALALQPNSVNLTRFWMLFIGVGSGLFVVPLQSFVQFQSPANRLGQVLAATSWMGWVGIVCAAQLIGLFDLLDLTPRIGFLVMAILTGVLSVVCFIMLPDFFFRFFLLVFTRITYRLNVKGLENVPRHGPALLVCNHVSWADALLIIATQQRRVRFLMSKAMLRENKWMRPFARLMHVIPVHKGDTREGIRESLAAARQALDEGWLVCIFAEGHLTRTGGMLRFRSGFERILKDKPTVPLVPVYIGGAWGSITSYAHGKLFSRLPVALPYPVELIFGEHMSSASKAFEVRQRVLELSAEFFEDQKRNRDSLGREFVRSARSFRRQRAICDSSDKCLNFVQTLTASILFADHLRDRLKDDKHVGLLLPTCVAGVLGNVAVSMLGKIPVNLNYTIGPTALASCVRQCDMRTVIASRLFLKKLPDAFELPENVIYLEDLAREFTTRGKLKAWLKARFWPARLLVPQNDFSPDDTCTIIFSSGTTGEPKGVMLSHHNVLSNIESFRMVLQTSKEDNVCTALPFFHSFGFTITMWYPLLSGISVAYHPNPLEAGKIAALAREAGSTLLVATPTFLQSYTRRAKAEDFARLRYCVVGAEKLKKPIADAFEEKFGIRPLEGYGTTECSPAVAINLPDVKVDGIRQIGTREGSVGQPLPGIVVKVTDPESFETLSQGKTGLLWIKGPNIMTGYHGRPDLTADVLVDGWYNTGDMASISRDGFVTLTDRLSRFSKIGGEMVPHLGVEEELHRILGADAQVIVITGVPDARKGEKLVMLHTPEVDLDLVFERLKQCELPNLWKPLRKNAVEIPEIPILGSGKVDLKKIKAVAREHFE